MADHIDAFIERWGVLVDLEFLRGLTPREAQEKSCLDRILTAAEEPWYRRSKAILSIPVCELPSRNQAHGPRLAAGLGEES